MIPITTSSYTFASLLKEAFILQKHRKSQKLAAAAIIIIPIIIASFVVMFFYQLTDDKVHTSDFEYETESPDAKEVLAEDPDADIFQYDGIIYQTDIDAVKEKSLTKDELIGEIKETTETGTDFEDEIANKLPTGAAIFSTEEEDEMFLIVESEGETLTYYALVEG